MFYMRTVNEFVTGLLYSITGSLNGTKYSDIHWE